MSTSSAASTERTFDRVVSQDGQQSYSWDAFFALALDVRIRFLLTSRPRFFVANGEIPRNVALRLR